MWFRHENELQISQIAKSYEKDSTQRPIMWYQLRLDEVCVFPKAVDPQKPQLEVVFLRRENGRKVGVVE